MKRKAGRIITYAVVGMLLGQSAYSQNRDIGFSKRFGGTEDQRALQVSIADNTAALLESVRALAEQMNRMTIHMERINASLQDIQKSMDQQMLEIKRGSGVATQQRDVLNLIARYLARQQQVNEALLEENRKIRQVLETKGASSAP